MTIYHKHHIVPRYMGGTDELSNIIILTPLEHAEAHRKLYEQYGNIQDFIAWKGLSGHHGKDEYIKARCSLGGKNGGKKLLGKSKTKEHKTKISLSLTGKKQTDQHIKNVAESLRGSKSSCSKLFKFVSPNGEVFIEKGLNDFCRRNGLSQGNMHSVANGIRSHHKGWKCEKINDDTFQKNTI